MATTDARPVPRRAAINRVSFTVFDTAGKVITGGLAALTATVSKDNNAYAPSANAPVEIGTSGSCYIELSALECTADSVVLKVTCSNANSVDTVVTLYPEEAGDIRVNLTQIDGSATLLLKFATAVGTNEIGTVTSGAFAPTNTEFETSDITDATPDLYKGRFLIATSGSYIKKATKITGYSKVGANGHFVVENTGSPFANNDKILIL